MSDQNTSSKLIIVTVVAIALLMETLDTTIISTAIPKIAISFNENPIILKFSLISYLLSLSFFIPASGWISDNYGARNVFFIAICIFVTGSMLCGASSNLITLVISRFIQGIGGALMMPVGRIILIEAFPKKELIRITNAIAIPSLIGPALGPVVGGWITTYWSWRWIFYINIPFGLICAYLTIRFIRNKKSIENRCFDSFGFLLFVMATTLFSIGFESIGEQFYSAYLSIALLFCSMLFLYIYKIHARKKAFPFIGLNIFKIDTFKYITLGSFWSRIGFGGMPFLLPLLFQNSFQLTPLYSGLLIFPMPIGMLVMKFFITDIVRKYGFRTTTIYNSMALGLCILIFSSVNETTPYVVITGMIFLYGLCCSLHFACLDVLSYSSITNENLSKATSIASTVQQLSMSFGVAISALLLKQFSGVVGPYQPINTIVFQKTFLCIGLITFTSVLIFIRLNQNAGNETELAVFTPD